MPNFKIVYGVAIVSSLALFAGSRIARYAERQQWWTLRFRLSLCQPYVLTWWILYIGFTLIIALHNFQWAASDTEKHVELPTVLLLLASIIIIIVSMDLALSTFETRHYVWVRWKAWTGPSRTGIPPAMARYISTSKNWVDLAAQKNEIKPHPVEKFAGFLIFRDRGIVDDPTDLLRTAAAIERNKSTPLSPLSHKISDVYHPVINQEAVSLLWGENTGFQRRCSRGIISIPPNLLKTFPSMKEGLSGNAVCVAYGILARNKGLDPGALICNLRIKNSFREFEETGLWPHPAKTLRSYYYTEFNRTFKLLGQSYVTAATELAVLLADTHPTLINGWLNSQFEHQELLFNQEVHALGASKQDLNILYRGHYAAMLISLSLYRKGNQIRPELAVFDAVCRFEDMKLPFWASSAEMEARRQREMNDYGPELNRLVNAVI